MPLEYFKAILLKEILRRRIKYCPEFYNHESYGDSAVLDCIQPPEEDLQQILREEVEIAVALMKTGKSAGDNNQPAELLAAGGETIFLMLNEIGDRIWRSGKWRIPRILSRIAHSTAALTKLKPTWR